MTVLVVLVVLAVVFGVGAVLDGLACGLLIALVLVAAAAWSGCHKLPGRSFVLIEMLDPATGQGER